MYYKILKSPTHASEIHPWTPTFAIANGSQNHPSTHPKHSHFSPISHPSTNLVFSQHSPHLLPKPPRTKTNFPSNENMELL